MSELRRLLKIACRMILALGLAGAAVMMAAPLLIYSKDPDGPNVAAIILTGFPAGFALAASTVLAIGGLRLLISVDERLERLVDQAGGQ